MEAHRFPWQVATFMHDKGTTLYDEGKAQMLFFWRSFAFSYEEERRRRKEGSGRRESVQATSSISSQSSA